MAIKMSQGLKQTQSLAMTPQLQQAIKLLTLTHLEMTNVIAEEMVENPMLEEMGGESEGDAPADEAREATSDDFSEAPLMKDNDDFDWDSYADSFNSNSSAPNMASPSSDSDEMPTYDNVVSKSMTLAEHLEWQLKMETLTADEWKIANLIIGNINDDGYLDADIE
jgi:RNA polymerase sigma-54 factor